MASELRLVEGGGGYESSGSYSGSDDNVGVTQAHWWNHSARTLDLADSVYDQSLVVPICLAVTAEGRDRGAFTFKFSDHLRFLPVLTFSLILQISVLWKVFTISEQGQKDTLDSLWEVCQYLDPDAANISLQLDAVAYPRPENNLYLDCGLLSTTMMSNAAQLDLNHDGIWTLEEAATMKKTAETELNPGRIANFPNIFKNLMRMAKNLELNQQYTYDEATSRAETQDYTVLPMTWMAAQQNYLSLCSAVDPTMCTNLEKRDILAQKLPEEPDVEARITLCENIVSGSGFCGTVFGERYKLYRSRKSQLCGDTKCHWDPVKKIRMMVYSASYDNALSKDSVIHISYILFMFVILFIWIAAVLEEFRDLWLWLVVTWNFPTCGTDEAIGDDVCAIEDENVVIKKMPRCHKWFTLVFVWFPRTVVAFALLVVGALFLLRSTGYYDMILNSVALVFVVEIDNMVFKALCSDESKQILGKVGSLTVDRVPTSKAFNRILSSLDASYLYGALCVLVVGGMEYHSYTREHGRLESANGYVCLCQVAQPFCSAAQTLGGLPTLPADDIAMFR